MNRRVRGVGDHATIQRWVVKYSPPLATVFHYCKRPVYVSWRMEGREAHEAAMKSYHEAHGTTVTNSASDILK
jgi:transposase-like protein